MALAVETYRNGAPQDGLSVLDLRWTSDERAFLDLDLDAFLAHAAARASRDAASAIARYAVDDPYGSGALAPAASGFFDVDVRAGSIVVGAGVVSLLHALSTIAAGGSALVAAGVYPDLPHWVDARAGTPGGFETISEALDRVPRERPALVFLERPALGRTDDCDVASLRDLCDRAGRHDGVVVVDESNANYRPPEDSAVRILSECGALVVLRGFSKAYGLGGLRCAMALSGDRVAGRVRAAVAPLLASTFSIGVVRELLLRGDVARGLRRRIGAAKPLCAALLVGGGLADARPSGSDLPYVFAADSDGAGERALARRGVLGKRQPTWTPGPAPSAAPLRLSVPLSDDRLETLRRRLGAAPGRPA